MTPVQEQALRWFTRLLDLPADHPDHQAFAQWLAADPAHAREYEAFSRVWGRFSSTSQTQALAGAMETLGRRRLLRNGAVGGVLLAVMSNWLLSAWSRSGEQMLVTGIGERRELTLADGSRLFLDADTRLHVALDAAARQVFLLQGRVIFDVSHDAARPFTVNAGGAQVRVLGTRFVVERIGQQVQVSVAEGRVQFSSASQQLILEPDQVGLLTAQGDLQRVARLASSAFSFAEGTLEFESANLGEIAATLSRYRQVPVSARQPQWGSISAVVQIADVERFLNQLPQLAGVRLEHQPKVTLLVAR